MDLKLYSYWRSSAAYRLRIALALKGLEYETLPVNIAPNASEQTADKFRAINPQMRVPVLAVGGSLMSQSMATLEWLEEEYPEPPLLPGNSEKRQKIRSFADTVACDIHPLNNLSVLKVLKEELKATPDDVSTWYADWIRRGFEALEIVASYQTDEKFLFGPAPTLAEVCLIPQMYNARRFNMDLADFPRLESVEQACLELAAFQTAIPENQPDAPN